MRLFGILIFGCATMYAGTMNPYAVCETMRLPTLSIKTSAMVTSQRYESSAVSEKDWGGLEIYGGEARVMARVGCGLLTGNNSGVELMVRKEQGRAGKIDGTDLGYEYSGMRASYYEAALEPGKYEYLSFSLGYQEELRELSDDEKVLYKTPYVEVGYGTHAPILEPVWIGLELFAGVAIAPKTDITTIYAKQTVRNGFSYEAGAAIPLTWKLSSTVELVAEARYSSWWHAASDTQNDFRIGNTRNEQYHILLGAQFNLR